MSLLTKLLFPPRCAACGSLLDWYRTQDTDALCPTCLCEWESAKDVTCGICGSRVTLCACVTEEMRKAKCTAFRKLNYYHGGTRDRVQNRVIFHIKESRDARAFGFLAKELSDTILSLTAESCGEAVLTYVPRGRSAKLEYGTDQAEQLAKALARVSGLPCQRLIRRSRRRAPEQKELSATARKKNAKAAFSLMRNADVRGRNVILVDDIVTTGNTVSACTRLLRCAGAKSVYCVAVASDDVNHEMT